MIRTTMLLLLCFSSCFLSSCVETRYLEKLGLITAVGYDQADDEKITGTMVLYQFNPAMQDVEKVLISKSKTSKGIRLSQNLETDHKLVSGQLRITVYGRELAEKGISHLVDTLERDSSIGNMVYLTIADTTAEQILNYQMTERPSNMGTYLYNLVRQNVESETLVSPTLQEFITDYGSVGKDPILPLLKASDGKVGVDGFALFTRDKFIKEIKKDKIFFIRSLMEDYNAGSVEVELPLEKFEPYLTSPHLRQEKDKVYIMIDSIKSSHKIKTEKKATPSFEVKLKIESRLLEMSEEMKLSDPKALRLLEDEIGDYIEKNIKEMILMLQEQGTDPIGFGMEYKSIRGHEDLSREKWDKLYKDASFHVKVENKIIRTGVID
ncbi:MULTISPECIES: Ger(x)C family spore germination protein [Rossellomorea]|jgi:spore germination protein|uniref:Ger(X)C family spore germination protein n=1 Tax=Rossellomorea aquimaris TaxID=189382 RepID=A0A5D4TWX7_9BACI|nr:MULTISPECIES: Ger(x)C family spore germination protein [Rossellomorea]MDT9024404.1 Ger(x)C family spore germination protein [Rossellomorea sp. YC4-1]TYS75241.1 Ger(x)C family spore germination protein [Rossellomorea aquimaris]TYS79618.1 Ger(x)C family spore germination protein [Rossellomorea aquimaris]